MSPERGKRPKHRRRTESSYSRQSSHRKAQPGPNLNSTASATVFSELDHAKFASLRGQSQSNPRIQPIATGINPLYGGASQSNKLAVPTGTMRHIVDSNMPLVLPMGSTPSVSGFPQYPFYPIGISSSESSFSTFSIPIPQPVLPSPLAFSPQSLPFFAPTPIQSQLPIFGPLPSYGAYPYLGLPPSNPMNPSDLELAIRNLGYSGMVDSQAYLPYPKSQGYLTSIPGLNVPADCDGGSLEEKLSAAQSHDQFEFIAGHADPPQQDDQISPQGQPTPSMEACARDQGQSDQQQSLQQQPEATQQGSSKTAPPMIFEYGGYFFSEYLIFLHDKLDGNPVNCSFRLYFICTGGVQPKAPSGQHRSRDFLLHLPKFSKGILLRKSSLAKVMAVFACHVEQMINRLLVHCDDSQRAWLERSKLLINSYPGLKNKKPINGADLKLLSTCLDDDRRLSTDENDWPIELPTLEQQSKQDQGKTRRIIDDVHRHQFVCLEHFRVTKSRLVTDWLIDAVKMSGGVYNPQSASIHLALRTPGLSNQFFVLLRETTMIRQLQIVLPWDIELATLKALQDAIVRSSVVILQLDWSQSSASLSYSTQTVSISPKDRNQIITEIMSNQKLTEFTQTGYDDFIIEDSTGKRQDKLQKLDLGVSSWSRQESYCEALLRVYPNLQDFKLRVRDVKTMLSSVYKYLLNSARLHEALTRFEVVKSADEGFAGDSRGLIVFGPSNDGKDHKIILSVDVDTSSLKSSAFTTSNLNKLRSIRLSQLSELNVDQRWGLPTFFSTLILDAKVLSEVAINCPACGFGTIYGQIADVVSQKSSTQALVLRLEDPSCNSLMAKFNYKPELSINADIFLTEISTNHLGELLSSLGEIEYPSSLKKVVIPNNVECDVLEELAGVLAVSRRRQGKLTAKHGDERISGLEQLSVAMSNTPTSRHLDLLGDVVDQLDELGRLELAVDLSYDGEEGSARVGFIMKYLERMRTLWITSLNTEGWLSKLWEALEQDQFAMGHVKRMLGSLEELVVIYHPESASETATVLDSQHLESSGTDNLARILQGCSHLRRLYLHQFMLTMRSWNMILEAIPFTDLNELSFVGSNFESGQISRLLD
ncbi:hypothetical protein BGW38_010180 [Lunasporangiospora selenospora]|uniref:Uncharacterized protein n=1 Tax=Lunasporangiospora selenospora TaxID=979761 RepID=A0A9P6G2W4_9FUNG|nr:hypothetical protein BGW38_010180 [Lunasporangiospora selenospora]